MIEEGLITKVCGLVVRPSSVPSRVGEFSQDILVTSHFFLYQDPAIS